MCYVSSWSGVTWIVALHDDFAPEYDELPEDVQDELLAMMGLLEQFGPRLGRPERLPSREFKGTEVFRR
jgi:hypothetical protein